MDSVWRPNKKDVISLRGQLDFTEQYTHARQASNKFRKMLSEKKYVHALSAMNGPQAIQIVQAGVPLVYLSGWQLAVSGNNALSMYPDIGLYPSSSMVRLGKDVNNALRLQARIDPSTDYMAPLIADLESGFGTPLHVFELTKQFLEAGISCVHIEDQAAGDAGGVRRCGHTAGKIIVPASQHIKRLKAARLAAEVCDVDMPIIARTDAKSAGFLTSDIDKSDANFIDRSKDREKDGLYHINGSIDMAIQRGLQYAPYADMLWMEDSTPSLDNAIKFSNAIHKEFPDKMLSLNCSPSFNWRANLSDLEIENFQKELSKHGYKYFFITLSGFHNMNYSMFDMAKEYSDKDMIGYVNLQSKELESQKDGFRAVKHQSFSGMSYFDKVMSTIDDTAKVALKGSTEEEQF